MKPNTLKLFVVALTSLFITSCDPKKDDPKPSSNSKVEGEWLLEYDGVDNNRNGQLDFDERNYPFQVKEYFTFQSGGKGQYKTIDETGNILGSANFLWQLDKNDTEIILDSLGDIYASPIKINARIINLTQTEFNIEYQETNYNNETYPAWMAFKKP